MQYDNAEAGRIAAAHLFALGHRRVIYVDVLAPSPARAARVTAAAELIRKVGGSFQSIQTGSDAWGVPECVRLLQSPDRPTAAICVLRVTAEQMAAAAEQIGLDVPRSMSVLCLGNVETVATRTSFTHVSFDHDAMGVKAFERLLTIESGEEPRVTLVPVRLVDHGTTAPPAEQA